MPGTWNMAILGISIRTGVDFATQDAGVRVRGWQVDFVQAGR